MVGWRERELPVPRNERENGLLERGGVLRVPERREKKRVRENGLLGRGEWFYGGRECALRAYERRNE